MPCQVIKNWKQMRKRNSPHVIHWVYDYYQVERIAYSLAVNRTEMIEIRFFVKTVVFLRDERHFKIKSFKGVVLRVENLCWVVNHLMVFVIYMRSLCTMFSVQPAIMFYVKLICHSTTWKEYIYRFECE